MNIKKNLRNILLSSFAALFTVLQCSPSSFAVKTKSIKEGWDTESYNIINDVLLKHSLDSSIEADYYAFNRIRESIQSSLSRAKQFERLPIKGITYDALIHININNSLYHICYGDIKNKKITSGGHLGCMKKFEQDLESKTFFSEKYNRPEAIRKLIIEKIPKANFQFYSKFNYNLGSKKYQNNSHKYIYKGSVEVPGVGTTIDGTVLNYLEFVVYYDCIDNNCVLVSCYPSINILT